MWWYVQIYNNKLLSCFNKIIKKYSAKKCTIHSTIFDYCIYLNNLQETEEGKYTHV